MGRIHHRSRIRCSSMDFVGVTLAWQLLFFAIAYRPVRLRPVISFRRV